jgi:predicted permease
MLTESGLLGLAGGLVGLLVAWGLLDLLVTSAGRLTEQAPEIRIDGVVVLFTIALSLLAGIGVGVVASRQPVGGGTLAPRATSRQGLRRGLVVAQLAVAVVLLAGAGLLVRSLIHLSRVDPGFDSQGVLTARLDLDWSRYDGWPERADFHDRLLHRLGTSPGIVSVALAGEIPLSEQPLHEQHLRIESREEEEPRFRSTRQAVSPEYFRTLAIERLEGRTFRVSDNAEASRVAVVSASLARRYWGEESPLGRRLSLDDGKHWRTVVGVVEDVRHAHLARPGGDVVYVPMAQNPRLSSHLLVRTVGDPLAARAVVQRVVHHLDPRQPVAHFRALEEMRRDAVASPRRTAVLLSLFAVLALAIAATGVAGLLAYSVSRRTREIGLRMALGAARGDVLALVLRQGLALVALGLGLGLAVALLGSRLLSGLLRDLLYGVEPTDPLTFGTVALILLSVAALSAWIPARRATAIDPMRTLRCD